MKNKILFVVLALIVLVGAFFLQSYKNKQTDKPVVTEQTTLAETTTEATTATTTAETATTEATTALAEATEATTAVQITTLTQATTVTREATTEVTTCNTVRLTVDYSILKGRLDKADANGGIVYSGEYEPKEGDTAFDVLKNSMLRAGIHLEFNKTPAFNSYYIEGIDNVYEFDYGELSGWVYKVNGTFPAYASSEYKVKPGDEIVFVYTCDSGRDAGNEF